MTTDEIKVMFDAAGLTHTTSTDYIGTYIVIDNQGYKSSCPCHHQTEDDAYQCIWHTYLGETDE
jgi:hypothetical protein